jgi:hypothetical protein
VGEVNFGPDTTTTLPEHGRGSFFVAVFDGDGKYVHSVGLPAAGEDSPSVALDATSNVLFAARYTGSVDLGGGDLPANGTSDMLVAKLDPDGGHVWSKNFGGPEGQQTQPTDMAITPNGDAVITGAFSGTVTFGGQELQATRRDGYLVRLSGEDGAHVYSVRIGDDADATPDEQWGKGVGVDAMGRAVVAGMFVNSVHFGSGNTYRSSAAGFSGWVAQYDPEGTLRWSTVFTHADSGTVEISGVDVDPACNAGVVGLFSGSATFQGASGPRVKRQTTDADDVDLFIVRLSANGTHSWSKQLGDSTDQRSNLPFQGGVSGRGARQRGRARLRWRLQRQRGFRRRKIDGQRCRLVHRQVR